MDSDTDRTQIPTLTGGRHGYDDTANVKNIGHQHQYELNRIQTLIIDI
jgi:hypothetical protein